MNLPLPDLLFLDERATLDPRRVEELLELSFLGKEGARGLDRAVLPERSSEDGWDPELFAEDLFLDELVRANFRVEIDGLRFPVNHAFLSRILSRPPTDRAAVLFRQEILRELETAPELLVECRTLYRRVSVLLDMFKAPDHTAQLDINAYRLDVLRQARSIIDHLAEGFGKARSGLRRLHDKGLLMQRSPYYLRLCDLLDYEARQSTLTVSLNIGADGEVKDLRLLDQRENKENPFYVSPGKSLWLRAKAFISGYSLSRQTLVQGILHRVFEEVSPALVPMVQVGAHLEFYLAAISFRDRLESAGLAASLPRLTDGGPVRLRGLANPLLLPDDPVSDPAGRVVSCDVVLDRGPALTLITGPNSGGKTRLLQSLGLCQMLAQSGVYVPAADADLPVVRGMFVSLVETETVDQAEGRLGRELMRIRRLFAQVGTPSLVVLDELCSGTNPSEGIEIFSLVLTLLDRMGASGFVSTHFLDFARRLEAEPTLAGLRFLQVEPTEPELSTYQFVPGVAESSLAAETARRLGVTFEALAELIDERLENASPKSVEPAPGPTAGRVSR